MHATRFTKFIPISGHTKRGGSSLKITRRCKLLKKNINCFDSTIRPERFGRSTCPGLKFGGSRERAGRKPISKGYIDVFGTALAQWGPHSAHIITFHVFRFFFLEQARAVCIIIPEQLYAHRLLLSLPAPSLSSPSVRFSFFSAWWLRVPSRVWSSSSLPSSLSLSRNGSPLNAGTTSYGSSREQTTTGNMNA